MLKARIKSFPEKILLLKTERIEEIFSVFKKIKIKIKNNYICIYECYH